MGLTPSSVVRSSGASTEAPSSSTSPGGFGERSFTHHHAIILNEEGGIEEKEESGLQQVSTATDSLASYNGDDVDSMPRKWGVDLDTLPRRRSSFGVRPGKVLPVRIDIEKLQYRVRKGRGPAKAILKDVSLTILPGQLLAIMGPSGGGKTSLLRVLHGNRQAMKHITGNVSVNGTPVRNIASSYRKLCSLVPQEEVLLPCFTVQETLLYAALLRLPQRWGRHEKALIVEQVLSELGLMECKDVLVGSVEKKGISGGQRHRLSIGLELLVDPSVLLLDEPTSGLDSTTAEDMCGLLLSLAQPGRCVVCSIHQPSARIFRSFDRVVFLVNGQLAYDGPRETVAAFFSSIKMEVPSYENPADHYMRVLRTEPARVLEGWASFSRFASGDGMPAELEAPRPDATATWLAKKSLEAPSGWWQFAVLFARMMCDSCKDPGKLLSGILMECTAGLLMGLVWYQQPLHRERSIVPITGVMIMLTTIAIFDSTVGVSLKFPMTRALHFREYSNGYYALLPYYLASWLSSCLLISTYQILQALIVFFMVGLDFTAERLTVFLLVLVLAACIGASLGFLLGTLTPNIQRIQQIVTPFLMPMLIFSGYMLPLPDIPKYLRWLYYSSVFQYIYSTLLRVHFVGLVFDDCHAAQLGCYRTGEAVLHKLQVDPEGTPRAIGVLFLILSALCVSGYLVLRHKSR